jgi:tetratricopeptide (TPR) repeat protein
LALDQAGAFIEETGCGLKDYLGIYHTQRSELLNARGGLVEDHREPVATTWSISFRNVEQKNPAAADLLRLCAFLHPDAIPEEMITEGASHLGSHLQKVTSDPLLFQRAIAELRAYSLVGRDANEKTLSIHRLVQAVIRDAMDDETRHLWAERAVQVVNEVFPEAEFTAWPQCERYLPHALVCAEQIAQEQIRSLEAARLLDRAGWYLDNRARYTEAEPLCRQALSICEQHLGPEHPLTAQGLHNLAVSYYEQGKYAEAEPLFKRALAIRTQVLKEGHPLTQSTRQWYALLLRKLGREQEATALETQGQTPSEEH